MWDVTLLVDKIIPFLRKKKKIELLYTLNLFQFYLQRFGIGKTISFKISNRAGIHQSMKIIDMPFNMHTQDIKLIFEKSNKYLDKSLEQLMKQTIKLNVELYNYRGDRYILKLPLHGQRRRANAKTPKKIRPI
jgi:ribosomal protein S13